MIHRFRRLIPILFLLLTLSFGALAEEADFPLTGSQATVDRKERISLLLKSSENEYEWSSSDKDIATVDYRGRVTGRKVGVCVITAEAKDGATYACTVTVTQPVTRVKIAASSHTMDRGKTYQIEPQISPDNATDKTITYTSSDESVAAVDENGIVTAVKAGKATITATAKSGEKDTIKITVTQPVTSVTLSSSAVTIEVDDSHKLTTVIEPADATSKTLTWTTSNKKIATVSSKGVISAKKAGTCVITATAKSGVSVSCTVTVTQPVTRVKIAASSHTMDRGKTYQIEPQISPSDATDKTITYTSSDESVAAVDENGVVTAVKAGKATITATAKSGKKDTIKITVTQPVTSVTLSSSAVTIDRGNSHKLTTVIEPADATSKTLTWTTSDKKIATVSSKGIISAQRAGTCIITATAKSGVSVFCTVTVTQPVTRVKIAASSHTMDRGKTYQIEPQISPDNATDKTITYTSSDESVATVDENGVVTAVKAGKATITATAKSGKKDTIKITVTQPVTSVTLSSSAVTIEADDSHKLTTVIEPADATSKTLTWTTSDKNIARVSSSGSISAKKAGTCVITATAKSGVSVSCTVTVTQPVTSVKIAASSKTVSRNSTYAVEAVIKPSDATDKRIAYHSSNPAVASVTDDGVVAALADGMTVITATAHNGKKDTIRIKVETVEVESVTVDQGYVHLNTGASAQINASVAPSDASERGVHLYSSNPAVAAVDEQGVITAVSAGDAVIYAVSKDDSGISDSCRVFVREPDAPGRLEGIVIGINPGHQIKGNFSKDPLAPGSKETGNKIGVGCTGVKTKRYEYQVNLEVSLLLKELLEAEGAKVVITRTANDVNITNIERAKMLNAANVDLALQIHCNSSATGNSNANGIVLYVKPTDQPAYHASQSILTQMVEHTGAKNLGIKTSNHYMSLNWSETPSILVEMGYMSNPKEDVLLNTHSYQMKLAAGMYEGIARYFGR